MVNFFSRSDKRYRVNVRLVAAVAAGVILAGAGRGEAGMHAGTQRVVREAAGAGRWFPANPEKLRSMVAGFIDRAQPPAVTGRIVAAIAPHAGYQYSGPVAGYVFRAIRDQAKKTEQPETVVVIGLSHRAAFPGVALMDGDILRTPLGDAHLDTESAAVLVKSCPAIRMDYGPHYGEHSAENQVPFVQAALPNVRLVVGLLGDHDPLTVKSLVAVLSELASKKKILLVSSSDMLHDPDYDLVAKTDRKTLQAVAAMDVPGLMKQWSPRRQIFCGMAPVAVAMGFAAAQGCKEGQILYYRNSGDDFPDSRGQWVVGYGAVVFAAPAK